MKRTATETVARERGFGGGTMRSRDADQASRHTAFTLSVSRPSIHRQSPTRRRQECIRDVSYTTPLVFAGRIEGVRRSRVQVGTENVVGIIIAVCLVGYLVLAFFFPEKF